MKQILPQYEKTCLSRQVFCLAELEEIVFFQDEISDHTQDEG